MYGQCLPNNQPGDLENATIIRCILAAFMLCKGGDKAKDLFQKFSDSSLAPKPSMANSPDWAVPEIIIFALNMPHIKPLLRAFAAGTLAVLLKDIPADSAGDAFWKRIDHFEGVVSFVDE